jgi:hypothetical protein
MTLRRFLSTTIVWAVAAFGPASGVAQDAHAEGTRQITKMSGDLYLMRDGAQCSVFVVTPDGVILGDPLGRETALWLREELTARFQLDVRFVLHSSHLYTRAAGSSVFSDTASVIGHWALNAELAKARRELPDRYRFALRTNLVYSKTRLVTLGGQSVVMIHVPAPRTPDMTILHFPQERVVFAVDPPGIWRVPFVFGEFKPADVFAWIDTLSPLGFDSLLFGDGRVLSRAEFDELARYVAALREAVMRGVERGNSLSQIQSTAGLDRFRTNPHDANRASHLSAIYTTLRSVDVRLSVGAVADVVQLSPAFCASRSRCAGGGVVPAAVLTVSSIAGKGLGVAGELTLSGQIWSGRTGPGIVEEAETKRSRIAVLARYGTRPSKLSMALIGGASLTIDDVRGYQYVQGALLPSGGRHPFEQRRSRWGATAGVDVESLLGRGVAIRLPIRVTRVIGGNVDGFVDSKFDVKVGVDVIFSVSHRVTFR